MCGGLVGGEEGGWLWVLSRLPLLYIRFSCYQDVNNMFVCVCRCVWYVLTKQTTFIQL